MTNSTWCRWQKAVAVAVLVSPGILGVGPAATAAPLHSTAAVSVNESPTNISLPLERTRTAEGIPADSSGIAPSGAAAETRGWFSVVIQAIKQIPSLLRKVSSAAKKGYAYFVNTAWPSIKAAVGAISDLVTAWEIWNYFN